MGLRPQQYRLKFPLTAPQVENIDTMFETLFRAIRNGVVAISPSQIFGTIPVTIGGTGIISYTIGDLLYASAATTLSKLPDVATGSVLVSGGVATAPAYSASPSLTSLTLSSLTAGRVVYAGVAGLLKDLSTFRFDGSTLFAPYMEVSANNAFKIDGNAVLATPNSQTNIFVGNAAGNYTLSGGNNVAVGQLSLSLVTTGNYNVAVGVDALRRVVAGTNNTAIGAQALANSVGNSSVAIGHIALTTHTQSTSNVAIGQGALHDLDTVSGAHNVAVGVQAGYDVTTGAGNTFLGVDAGRGFNLTGDHRFIAGSYTWPIQDVYFGSGEGTGDASAPVAYIIHGSGANSANAAGADLTIAAGKGTGTGVSGAVIFKYAPAGAAGSTQNALAEVFRITTGGNLGIGTTAPAGLVHISSNTAATGLLYLTQANASSDSFDILFRKARGTAAVPTIITSADELGIINFTGYGGASGYVVGAAIKGISSGTIADTRVPGQLSFWTGTDAAPTVLTERMTIMNDGSVGIGINNPSVRLHVYSTDSKNRIESTNNKAILDFYCGGGAANRNWRLITNNNNSALFQVMNSGSAGAEPTNPVAVFDGSGNFGIGTTAPAGLLHVSTDNTAVGFAYFTQAYAGAVGFASSFRKARGSSASPTVITTADELGVINFTGYGGAAGYITGAAIKGISSGTIADSRVPGFLSFWTGTDAAPSVLTERVRIDNAGNVGIGQTGPTAVLHLKAGTATASSAPLKFTSGTNLTTAEAGAVEYNGTNLFFTRAGTVRENVLVAIDNVAAPTTGVGVAIVNYYGSSATNYLGDPNRWLSVNVLGTTYKIPLYT